MAYCRYIELVKATNIAGGPHGARADHRHLETAIRYLFSRGSLCKFQPKFMANLRDAAKIPQ